MLPRLVFRQTSVQISCARTSHGELCSSDAVVRDLGLTAGAHRNPVSRRGFITREGLQVSASSLPAGAASRGEGSLLLSPRTRGLWDNGFVQAAALHDDGEHR